MLRRVLAVLLVFLWVLFSGYGLPWDLDLAGHFKAETEHRTSLPSVGEIAKLAKEIAEGHNRTPTSHPWSFQVSTFRRSIFQLDNAYKVFKNNRRIHKLHRVFLI